MKKFWTFYGLLLLMLPFFSYGQVSPQDTLLQNNSRGCPSHYNIYHVFIGENQPHTVHITGMAPSMSQVYKYNEGNWEPQGGAFYKTNEDGYLTEIRPEKPGGVMRKFYYYDSALVKKVEYYNVIDDSTVSLYQRGLYYYDTIKNKPVTKEEILQLHTGQGNFVNHCRQIRAFDSLDNQISSVEQFWENGQWKTTFGYKYDIVYLHDHVVDHLIQYAFYENSSSWKKIYKLTFDNFNPDGSWQTMTGYGWDPANQKYLPHYRRDSILWHDYDGLLTVTIDYLIFQEEYQRWTYSIYKTYNSYYNSFLNSSRSIVKFDHFNNRIESNHQHWNHNNNTWENDMLDQIFYDSVYNYRLGHRYFFWDGNTEEWITYNHRTLDHTFDSLGNLSQTIIKHRNENGYFIYKREYLFYEYYNQMGIKETKERHVNIYPNPSNTVLNIEYSSDYKILEMKIISVMGMEITEIQPDAPTGKQSYQISIAHLPAGMYILRIQTDKGFVTKKFTKL